MKKTLQFPFWMKRKKGDDWDYGKALGDIINIEMQPTWLEGESWDM